MRRIVYPQKGSGNARAALSGRHVTVKYKPSEKFLAQLKNRRKPHLSIDNQASEGGKVRATEPVQLPVLPEECDAPALPSKGRSSPSQLPRLRAFLDDAEEPKEAILPSAREIIERSSRSNRSESPKNRSNTRSGRSAYEELRARWRHR